MAEAELCRNQGNPDLYGLGIRLGIYLQWVSALVIYLCYPSGRRALAEAYTLFILAITITTIVITFQHNTTIIDIFVLSFLVFGGMFAALLAVARKRYRQKIELSITQEITLYVAATISSSYYIWFWARGVNSAAFGPVECGAFGFLFSRISLSNRSAQGFFIFCSVFVLFNALYGLWLFAVLERSIYKELKKSPRISGNDISEKTASKLGISEKIMEFYFVAAPYVNVVALIYSVLGIELTIYWNRIDGVYEISSTGQLIPLVIGLAGLAKVLYGSVKDWGIENEIIIFLLLEFQNQGRSLDEVRSLDQTRDSGQTKISRKALQSKVDDQLNSLGQETPSPFTNETSVEEGEIKHESAS